MVVAWIGRCRSRVPTMPASSMTTRRSGSKRDPAGSEVDHEAGDRRRWMPRTHLQLAGGAGRQRGADHLVSAGLSGRRAASRAKVLPVPAWPTTITSRLVSGCDGLNGATLLGAHRGAGGDGITGQPPGRARTGPAAQASLSASASMASISGVLHLPGDTSRASSLARKPSARATNPG